MSCDHCAHWTVRRVTEYASGEVITNWAAPPGRGLCDKLDIETDADFHCNKFLEDAGDHVVGTWKNGAPWQHWVMVPCPNCQGRGNNGSGACHRCAGTSQVRHYDDGYVGEEQTRKHPKEATIVEPPTCAHCKHLIQLDWIACPYCGVRVHEPPAETEFLGEGNAGGNYDDMAQIMARSRQLKAQMLDLQIKRMNDGNK